MIMTQRQHEYAKKKKYIWLYVDSDDYVYGINIKPAIITIEGYFGPILVWYPHGTRIGGYQGDLWWTNTLEKVI